MTRGDYLYSSDIHELSKAFDMVSGALTDVSDVAQMPEHTDLGTVKDKITNAVDELEQALTHMRHVGRVFRSPYREELQDNGRRPPKELRLSECGSLTTDGVWVHYDGEEWAHSDNPEVPVDFDLAQEAAREKLEYALANRGKQEWEDDIGDERWYCDVGRAAAVLSMSPVDDKYIGYEQFCQIVLESMTKTLFATAFADWEEEFGHTTPGEIMERLPEDIPEGAVKEAERLYNKACEKYGSMWKLFSSYYIKHGYESDLTPEQFGHLFVMDCQGQGVGLWMYEHMDDKQEFFHTDYGSHDLPEDEYPREKQDEEE